MEASHFWQYWLCASVGKSWECPPQFKELLMKHGLSGTVVSYTTRCFKLEFGSYVSTRIALVLQVYERCIIEDALICRDFGGQDLTALMEELLHREQHYVGLLRENFREIVRDIKAKVTYVAGDYEQYLDGVNGRYRHTDYIGTAKMRKQYKLRDGKLISLGFERFHCPEALFRPSLIGLENVGFHQAIFN